MEKPFKFHNLTFNHTLEGLLRIVSLPEALLLFGVKMKRLVSATIFLNVREMERIVCPTRLSFYLLSLLSPVMVSAMTYLTVSHLSSLVPTAQSTSPQISTPALLLKDRWLVEKPKSSFLMR